MSVMMMAASFSATAGDRGPALSGDQRIQTYVYSPSDVFRIMIHHGFQTHVEFALGEEIETVSAGDQFAWQISPVGRRLFIKPLEENVHTNLTVITNKRSYQFEVASLNPDDLTAGTPAFVVRFYYPPQVSQAPLVSAAMEYPQP